MYVVQVTTPASQWLYGPFPNQHMAKTWAESHIVDDNSVKIIQLVPVNLGAINADAKVPV